MQQRSISKTILIKGLPRDVDDTMLFEHFKEFGPVRKAKVFQTHPLAGVKMASITYHFYNCAISAVDEMHCRNIQGARCTVEFNERTVEKSELMGH
jgi:RNA recognition motif-containing protein